MSRSCSNCMYEELLATEYPCVACENKEEHKYKRYCVNNNTDGYECEK